MGAKTTDFDKDGIAVLPNDKPAVYKILNAKGENIYTGSAKKGRVKERLQEHLGGQDKIPGGVKIKIEQKTSIGEAQQTEQNIIARSKPKHNLKGK